MRKAIRGWLSGARCRERESYRVSVAADFTPDVLNELRDNGAR